MRHDRTTNQVIGRQRCGRKKALHIGNKCPFGVETTAGAPGSPGKDALRKPLISIG
jgi:hypothetical protein